MEILLARVWFGGRSCVIPTLCIEQEVQKPSIKGVFSKLAGPLKDLGASKAGCFQFAFLACWPQWDQHHSLAQKVPHGLEAHSAPELSHPSLLSLFECGTRRGSTSCPELPAIPPSAFIEGQSLRQSDTYPSCLCLGSHTQSAAITNICVEPRYGTPFL